MTAKTLYRAQILLEPEQHAALKRLAKRQDRSLSAVVRDMIQEALDRADYRYERRMAVLDEMRELREEYAEKYGVYEGEDPVEAVRREDAEDIDRWLMGEER